MSDLPPGLAVTMEVNTSSATTALEFALAEIAQLPPVHDEAEAERPAGSGQRGEHRVSEPPQGEIDCPHCHATWATMDVRRIVVRDDHTVVEIKHTKDCVDYPPPPERPGEEPTP